MSSSKRENPEQIPEEDDPQGRTGKVISEQAGVEGQRKEVNVESYSKVADAGQILKNIEFPTNKNKIIEHIKRQPNIQSKQEILTKLQQKLEDREYKNVSDITTTAGLVYWEDNKLKIQYGIVAELVYLHTPTLSLMQLTDCLETNYKIIFVDQVLDYW